MKVYQTVQLEQIGSFSGWDLDRVFTQRIPEQVFEQEAGPPSYPGGPPQTVTVTKYKTVKRAYALLSKDAEVASREAELGRKVTELEGKLKTASADAAALNKGLEAANARCESLQLARNEISATVTELRVKNRALEQGLADKQTTIDKLKTAIGEIRFKEIVGS